MGAAHRRVAFRPGARVGTIAASLAAAATLLLPNAALATIIPTEIGSAQGNFLCQVTGFDSVQVSSSGNSYAVPLGGISITSWSVLAGADAGPVGLEVWRPTAEPFTYMLVGSTRVENLSPGMNNFAAIDVNAGTAIDVHAGDLIGLRVEGQVLCQETILNPDGTPSTADVDGFSFGATPAPGGTVLMRVFSGFQLNIAATVQVDSGPPPPPTPTTADQCKHGGWQGLTDSAGTLFKNQGDCVSFVTTNGANLAAGQAP